MKSVLAIAVFCLTGMTNVEARPQKRDLPKPVFFLAGDSTTAPLGGWGDGFLTTVHGSYGTNYGKSGATTASFIASSWATVLAAVKTSKESYTPFVTIQFGHNDQKPTSGVTLGQFSANLERLAKDVWNAGGNPILVTSLTRRNFNSSTGHVIEDLAVQANATLAVAKSIGSYYIDLNRASIDYVNAIGKGNSRTYNLSPADYTHLNDSGAVLFGNLVSMLIDKAIQKTDTVDIGSYTYPNATIAQAITKGEYIYPSGFGTLVDSTAP